VSKNVLALGPFIGSFEQEILTFRPYMRWIELNTINKGIYYSSHFNRKFLYPQVSNKKYVPVYKQLTRQEIHQNGYSHKDVDQRDFMSLVRVFKDEIVDQTGCIKKDINHQSLPYVKYTSPVSIYHKIFEPIKVPVSKKKGNIVFIPDISMKEADAIKIWTYLKNHYKVSLLGDMKCHLPSENEVLKNVDYLQNGYKKIVTAITNATAVITPCSHWAVIANLQSTPCISWGNSIGQFREGGIYNFNNDKSKSVYYDTDGNVNNLINNIKMYLEEVNAVV
jgi:hypothetical protein